MGGGVSLVGTCVADAAGLTAAFGVCCAAFVTLVVMDVERFRKIELAQAEIAELHTAQNTLSECLRARLANLFDALFYTLWDIINEHGYFSLS